MATDKTTSRTESRKDQLKDAWERALESGKHEAAVKALAELEVLDAAEPRWSHRLGEAQRRVGRGKAAEDAFARAAEKYLASGFLPRAVAMAKLVATLNPSRADLLARLTPAAAPVPALGSPAATLPAAAPPTPTLRPAAPLASASANAPAALGGAPLLVTSRDVTSAPPASPPLLLSSLPPPPAPARPAPLARAADEQPGEVRFEDAPPASISLDLTDLIDASGAILLGDEDLELEDGPATSPVDMRAPLPEPSIDRLGLMAASRLFAALSRDALLALAGAAELSEFVPQAIVIARDEPAYALYAIVEGRARVVVRGAPSAMLGEGDVFGEACLLDEGRRQADVRAETALMTLRIDKRALDDASARFPEIGDVLFDLLGRRLVMNLMHTSPLFTVFEPRVRLELAQLFEVRRAAAGTVLAEQGRRTDGLYVVLAGTVLSTGDGGDETRIARGTTFGHGSLIDGGPSQVSVRAATESVVLRMSAAKFGALAALYPPALAYLSESTADRPPESQRILG